MATSQFQLFGISFKRFTVEEAAIEFLDQSGARDGSLIVTVHDVSSAMRVSRSLELREFYASLPAFQLLDGRGMHLAASLAGLRVSSVTSGPSLFDAVMRRAEERRIPVAFLGGHRSDTARIKCGLNRLWPGLQVVYGHHGYIADDNIQPMLDAVSLGARVIVLGISAPKRERLMRSASAARINAGLLPVGGVLDIVAGRYSRAPQWVQKVGLEWLHRTMTEPRRMAPRVISAFSSFALALPGEVIRQRLSRPIENKSNPRAGSP